MLTARKPPTKIFSRKELKRSRIDRRYRKGASASITEDLGTHFEKRELSFPKDLDVRTSIIPKGRSKYHEPVHLGDAFTIIHYTDTGNIFCYDRNKRFLGKLEEHDLMRQFYDIGEYFKIFSVNHKTGRVTIKKLLSDYIKRNYRNKLSNEFMRNPTFTPSNKSKHTQNLPKNSRKTANYNYITRGLNYARKQLAKIS